MNPLVALDVLFACVSRFSWLGLNASQSRAELANERSLEAYYGGDRPQTDTERCEVLASGVSR